MDSWGWLEPRATEELWARQFGGGFGGGNGNGNGIGNGSDDNDGNDRNSTDGRPRFGGGGGGWGAFRFQAAKSIRTSTIILSIFNILAAFATAMGILWDGYATAKRNNPKFSFRYETAPITLVSSTPHYRVEPDDVCRDQGSVFIVPYIQLVFGLEVVLRSFRRRVAFPPRGKWNVTVCLAIVGTLLLVTYLVTHFIRPPNFCFASLFWFVERYKRGSFVLLTIIAVALFASTIIIFIKLHRNATIDPTERVAASRMVYYLPLGFISTALFLPFFIDISFYTTRGTSDTALQLSMVAAVVANVSGLMTGGLHLFLRSTTLATIGPRAKNGKYEDDERENFKRGIRRWAPGDDEGDYRGPSPVGLRRMGTDDSFASASGKGFDDGYDDVYDKGYDKGYWDDAGLNPLRSHAVPPASTAPAVRSPDPARQLPTHAPKSSYSLFPGVGNGKPPSLLPAATYEPRSKAALAAQSGLKPPPNVHGFRHRRDSSLASHTTVQIGLRLSNAEDMPSLDSKYIHEANQVYNLECPNAVANNAATASKRPSPLSHVSAHSTEGSVTIMCDEHMSMVGGTGEGVSLAADEDKDCTLCTLAPAVYNPAESPKSAAKTKVTSPKGVGFTIPQSRSNSTGNPDQPQPKKPDWI
ncbi:uncharacterized protein DNG_01967 [Cephalotrichum gorgonifer]|uniref:Uncharacterized protein n=1 Tax=Cephalotrichum gorgonifer TaxID=2041049 RepID=A0AAE8MRL2_9PEZI|nr:uncharacterized protein DNG_01967 [Cephalotrichum gorgonifer]